MDVKNVDFEKINREAILSLEEDSEKRLEYRSSTEYRILKRKIIEHCYADNHIVDNEYVDTLFDNVTNDEFVYFFECTVFDKKRTVVGVSPSESVIVYGLTFIVTFGQDASYEVYKERKDETNSV